MPRSRPSLVTIDSRELKAAFRGAFPGQRATDLSTNWAIFWGEILKRAKSVEQADFKMPVADNSTPDPEAEIEDQS